MEIKKPSSRIEEQDREGRLGYDEEKLRDEYAHDPEVTKSLNTEKPEEREEKERSLKDRIMGIFGMSKDQLGTKHLKAGEDRIKSNPNISKEYQRLLKEEGSEVAEEYKRAVGKWRYVARAENGEFVDKTIYSVASGEVNRGEK